MTQNQKRKYILLPMLIIGVIALITIAVLRAFYEIDLGTWQYVIVPFWIALLGVVYLNTKKPTNNSKPDKS